MARRLARSGGEIMSGFIFLVVLPASFGILMENLGYGIVTRPGVFIPSAVIFSILCVFMEGKL